MKSKTSLFNSGIIKQDFKQHGWVGLVFLVGLFFALPLQMLRMTEDTLKYRYPHFESLFDVESPIQTFILCIVPVIAGIFIFRYLQVKLSADMSHSLPIPRRVLFINHLVSGLVMLLLPVWLTGLVSGMLLNFVPVGKMFTGTEVWTWLFTVSLFVIFIYVFTVFVGMVTGVSVAQGILSFILLILPAGLLTLISFNLGIFIFGFSEHYFSNDLLGAWSPIIHLAEIGRNPLTINETLMYIVLCLFFLGCSYYLYTIRHIESASQTITFSPLRPVFKYGVTFCAMLLAGSYFSINGDNAWVYFGYLIGSLLGYVLAEMVLMKTWRIFQFRLLINYFKFATIIVLVFIGIKIDISGYESRVPEASQIESVFYGHNVWELKEGAETGRPVFVENVGFIEKVRTLHKAIATERPSEALNHSEFSGNVIAYKLNNGKMIVREYRIEKEKIEQELALVLESSEYKTKYFRLDKLNQSMDQLTISAAEPIDRKVVITAQDEIKEIQQLINEEILTMSYEEMMDERISWANFYFLPSNLENNEIKHSMYDDGVVQFPWKKSFVKIEEWLEDKGYEKQVRMFAEDIKSIELAYVSEGGPHVIHPEEVFGRFGQPIPFSVSDTVVTKDQRVIEAALSTYSGYAVGQYFVKFNTVEGSEFFGVFPNEKTPQEIISLLEQ